jgi:hypothetical protein
MLTIAHADLSSNGAATNNCACSTQSVANYRASSDPPVVRTSSHGNSRDLTAVAPFSEESHNKSLYPRRAKEERKEVVHSAQSTGHGAPAW